MEIPIIDGIGILMLECSLTLEPGVTIGWKNYGFLLLGGIDPNKESGTYLFAGTDQHNPSTAYEYNTTWSSLRVYVKTSGAMCKYTAMKVKEPMVYT